MINLGKKLGFAALLALGTITSAQAIVLDTFEYDDDISFSNIGGTVYYSDGGPLSVSNTAVLQDFNIFNGDVKYTVNSSDAGFGTFTDSGALTLGNAPSGTSELELFYGQLTAGGVLLDAPVPFSAFGDSFYYDLQVLNVGNLAINDLDVTITVSSGAFGDPKTEFSVTQTFIEDINTLTRQTLSFDEFYNQGASAAFFDEVVSVTVLFNAGEAVDFELAEFGVIPEPSTVAIFGLALVGFAFSSRRKSK